MTIPSFHLSADRPIVRVRSDISWLPEIYRQRPTRLTVSFRPTVGERRLYRKKPVKKPSDWAPKYRKITYGPLKGSYYDPDFMPHMNGIMDTAAESCVQEIVNCKAPQTGGSANWETFLGNRADVAPGDALIVYPDREVAAKRCRDYLQPMFRDSPRLRRLLTGLADDEAALRVKLKTMLIYMGWGGSVASLGNVSVRYLLVDELDKCPEYPSKKEARFEDLVSERTTAFDRFASLKIWNSTPIASPSRIVAKLHSMDVIFDYHVRCPDCGHVQLMEFERFDFGGIDDPKEMLAGEHARYICAACGVLWNDRQRDLAVRVGAGWYARNPEERQRLEASGGWLGQPCGLEREAYIRQYRPVRVGFHAPAWISPLNSLAKCAAAGLAAQKDAASRIYFDTQIAAIEHLPFRAARREDFILRLRDDRPEGLVPGGPDGEPVAALVAGSDTQDNGHYYWIAAVGYGLEQPTWLVRAGFCRTDEELENILFAQEYRDSLGGVWPVSLCVKDAMGHRTAAVYHACIRNPGRLVPYKGAAQGRRARPMTITKIDTIPGTNILLPGSVQLYTCDSHFYKDLLAFKLNPERQGRLYLHRDSGDEIARHFCAETLDDRQLWINPGKRANHYWDSAFMAIIAAEIMQIKYWPREQSAAQSPEPLVEPALASPPPVAAGGFFGGRGMFRN